MLLYDQHQLFIVSNGVQMVSVNLFLILRMCYTFVLVAQLIVYTYINMSVIKNIYKSDS